MEEEKVNKENSDTVGYNKRTNMNNHQGWIKKLYFPELLSSSLFIKKVSFLPHCVCFTEGRI